MKHLLPTLPYAVSALEPHVDIQTMMLHHHMHREVTELLENVINLNTERRIFE